MNRSELIKSCIQKYFESGTSKVANKVCYGYSKAPNGSLIINEKESRIVRFIFDYYLSGNSLGKIVGALAEKQVPSPSGRDKWSRKVMDGLLLGKFLFKRPLPGTASRSKIIPIQGISAGRPSSGYYLQGAV